MRRVISAAAVVAATLAAPFTAHHEGLRLSAYLDPVGIPTICYGETQDVKLGDRLTKEQCDELFEARLGWFAYNVDLMTEPDLPAKTHAALTSFAYNIGVNGYFRSRTRKLFNQGQFEAACDAMMGWYKAGGKDCRVRSNNCYGLINRRNDEIKLCHEGLENYDT